MLSTTNLSIVKISDYCNYSSLLIHLIILGNLNMQFFVFLLLKIRQTSFIFFSSVVTVDYVVPRVLLIYNNLFVSFFIRAFIRSCYSLCQYNVINLLPTINFLYIIYIQLYI